MLKTVVYSNQVHFESLKNSAGTSTKSELCYKVTYADSNLHTCTYICRIIHSDTTVKTHEERKQVWRTHEGRHIDKNAGRKTQEDFFTITFTSQFICKVWKGLHKVACERVMETEHKLNILTPLLWPSRCVFLVLLDAQPRVLGSTPSGLFRGPPRSGVAFPTTSGLYCLEVCWQLLWHPTQLNYIIIQRPHDRPLHLWKRMFNRHQAEITVMHFRCYSLPVHHCSGTMGPSPCPM